MQTDGGVTKTITKLGTGFEKPEKGDTVSVHYVGTLEDGSKFDSSRDRGDPFSFSLQAGSVIKGWDVAVASMKKGEICRVKLTSEYGYGDTGSPPKIPGGATLIFEIELIEWKSVKDLVGDGGVVKHVMSEGEGYAKPNDRDEVMISYTVKEPESDELIAQASNVEFTLQDGHLCKGIPLVLKSMGKGESARVLFKKPYHDVSDTDVVEVNVTLHSWKKVEDVSEDGTVVKKILVEGSDWAKPNAGATCTISYTAYKNGEEIESKESVDFVVDEEQLPSEELESAVMKMKKGEKALVTVKKTGIEYDVTLENFVKAKDSWDMETSEKIQAACDTKEKGNSLFKLSKYNRAVKKWERALQYIDYDDAFEEEDKKKAQEVKKSLNLNLSAAYLKLSEPAQARKACDKVLEKEPNNMKALYRRAQAYLATKDFIEAQQDIKQGLSLHADDVDFAQLSKRCKVMSAASAKKEAATWAKAFQKMASDREAEPDPASSSPITEVEAH